jgi:hypothetical protein
MENLRHWTTLFGKKCSQEIGLSQKPTAAGNNSEDNKEMVFCQAVGD